MKKRNDIFKVAYFCTCLLSVLILFQGSAFAFSQEDQSGKNNDDFLTRDQIIYLEQKKIEDEKNLEKEMPGVRDEIKEFERENSYTTYGVGYGGFQYLDGDILITKKNITKYYTGHTGIVVGTRVLEITPGKNSGHPRSLSMADWFRAYPKTMVIRQKNRGKIPVKAAWYGKTFYLDGAGRNNTYSIASGLYNSNKDYYSSLVWKCYHHAGLDYKIYPGSVGIIPDFISPYDYMTYRVQNGFSAVHSVNWQ